MPYQIRKTPSGSGLFNIDKKIWKFYNTTKTKADSQKKLLEYIDAKQNIKNNNI